MQTFNRLVEPHREALRAYVLRLTDRDEAAADSILKETLHRAAGQEPRLFPERPSAVRQWLALLARDVVSDGERHGPAGHDDRPFWPDPDAAGPAGGTPAPATTVAPATTIAAAIEQLAAPHRRLIVELFYGGVSLEEAAADRRVPVERIKHQLYLAMRELHTFLDKHGSDRRR